MHKDSGIMVSMKVQLRELFFGLLVFSFCGIAWVTSLWYDKKLPLQFTPYFYKNNLQHLFKDPSLFSIEIFNPGGSFNLLFLVSQIAPSDHSLIVFTFVIVTVSMLIFYDSLKVYVPPSVSAALCSVIVLSPLGISLHEVLMGKSSNPITGFLFTQGLLPSLSLLGMSLLFRFSSDIKSRFRFKKFRTVLTGVFLYLIHPFLLMLLIMDYLSQILVRIVKKNPKTRIKRSLVLNFAILIGLLSALTIASLLSPENAMGTLTLKALTFPNLFELSTYLVLPVFLTFCMLNLMKVSLYEIVFRFPLIIVMFLAETSLYCISFISKNNLFLFLDFQGFSIVMHILYYLPIVHFISNKSRFYSLEIRTIAFQKLFKMTIPFLVQFLSLSLLVLVPWRVSQNIASPESLSLSRCDMEIYGLSRQISKIQRNSLNLTRSNVVETLLGTSCSDEQKKLFFSLPDLNPTNFRDDRTFSSAKGLAFLLLNDFDFSENASLIAKKYMRESGLKKND